MDIIEQFIFVVITSIIAIVCLRYPTTLVKLIIKTKFVDARRNTNTQAEHIASLIQHDPQSWKTYYPQLFRFIKLIGYLAIMFLFIFVLSVLLSMMQIA